MTGRHKESVLASFGHFRQFSKRQVIQIRKLSERVDDGLKICSRWPPSRRSFPLHLHLYIMNDTPSLSEKLSVFRTCSPEGIARRLVNAWYPTEFLKTSFQCRKRTADALSQKFDLPNLDDLPSAGEWSILTMWVLGHHKLLKNMHTGIAAACSRI